MKARIASLPPRAVLGIAVAGVLVYTIAVWFLLVAPKRADVTTAGDAVAAAQLRLADARLDARRPTRSGGTRVTDVLRLAKAMPSSADQAGLGEPAQHGDPAPHWSSLPKKGGQAHDESRRSPKDSGDVGVRNSLRCGDPV